MSDEIRAYLDEVDAVTLADHLIGGLTVSEGRDILVGKGVRGVGNGEVTKRSLVVAAMEDDDFILRPLPNSYFTRDPSAWIYGGVVVNPMYWPARRLEALNVEAIYRFHPNFRDAGFDFWYSREQEGESFGRASSEGGDIMLQGQTAEATPLTKQLNKLTNQILIIAGVALAISIGLGLARKQPFDVLFLSAVAFSVSAISTT